MVDSLPLAFAKELLKGPLWFWTAVVAVALVVVVWPESVIGQAVGADVWGRIPIVQISGLILLALGLMFILFQIGLGVKFVSQRIWWKYRSWHRNKRMEAIAAEFTPAQRQLLSPAITTGATNVTIFDADQHQAAIQLQALECGQIVDGGLRSEFWPYKRWVDFLRTRPEHLIA